MQIQVAGPPVKVFDHTTDQQEPYNIPDAQFSAWREADGTVNLMVPSFEAYRMRGPDLLHLTIDTKKIYSSTSSASEVPEAAHDYHHWLMGPYSTDGVHFYSVAHSEWYACLLTHDCAQPSADGNNAQLDSWANTVNDLASSDGGATWNLNVVQSSHVVAAAAYTWMGSAALSGEVYLHALNHSGLFQPSKLVQQGSFWYCVAEYIHRDFSKINVAGGVYQAPIDQYGYVLLRTADFTNPNGWQAWGGGATYAPVANQSFKVFLPQLGATTLNAAPPQLVFDTQAQVYVLIHALYSGGSAVYYETSPSLANPSWSPATAIVGTALLTTDPGGPLSGGSGTYGPVQGFDGDNYPSILDPASPGYNFEFTSGSPLLFFSTMPAEHGGANLARDIYRVALSVTYH